MHLLLDAKLLALVAFLLLVIITNLIKGYRTHKPRNEPFSLSEFVTYSKNRTSEFFGVTKNVYIAFCVISGFFTIVGVNAFMDKALFEAGRAQTKIEDAEKKLQELEENQPAIIREAAEKMNAELCEEANFLQKALTPVCNSSTTSTKASDEAVHPAAVSSPQRRRSQEIEPPEIISASPSAPLSNSEVREAPRDESLYLPERKRNAISPSSPL